MPNKEQDKLILELIKRQAAGVENALPVPVPSHRPVSDADILRTQLADYDQQRMEPARPSRQLGQELTPEQLNEAIANLIPGGGPAKAILPLGSPFRLKEYRDMRIAKLLEDMRAKGHGEDFITRFANRAKRNPRLLSQNRTIHDEAKLEGPFATGGSDALDVPLNKVGQEPIFDLHLNTKIANPQSRDAVIVHEGTHAARDLRTADRARRRERPDSIRTVRDEVRDHMAKEEQQAGSYLNMIDEVMARRNEEFNELRSNPSLTNRQRWQIARTRANDPVRANQRIEESFMTPDELEMKGQMNKTTLADRFQEILAERKSELYKKYIKKMFDETK